MTRDRRKPNPLTGGAMKLINCRRCDDVVKIVEKMRVCECGQSAGRELDGERVYVSGPCWVLGIAWMEYDGAGKDAPPRSWSVLAEPHPDVERH